MAAPGVDETTSGTISVLIIAIGVAAITVVVTAWGISSESRMVAYAGAVTALATVTYLVTGRSLPASKGFKPPDVPRQYLKGVDVAIFATIPICLILGRSRPIGLPWEYHLLVTAVATAILIRSVLDPSLVNLLQLLLVATLVRLNVWFSAPVIGKDSRAHADMTAYIVRNGAPIPKAITYNHDFPGGHLLSSAVVFVSGLGIKAALFVALAGSGIVGIVVVYQLTRRLFEERLRSPAIAALIAAFVVTFSLWHRQRSALPITQTLGLLFVPLLLHVTVFRSLNRRTGTLGVLVVATAVISHNTTPIVMLLAFGAYVLGEITIRGARWKNRVRRVFPVVSVLAFASLVIWTATGYINYHISRFLSVFSASDPVTERTGDPGGGGAVDTAVVGFGDPGLYVGFDIFLVGVVFGVLGYVMLTVFIRSDETGTLPGELILMAGLLLSMVTAGFVVGSGNIGRVFPVIIVVVAPVFGYGAGLLFEQWPVGTMITLLLVLSFPFVSAIGVSHGITHPGGSPADSTERPGRYLTHSEAAGLDYSRTYPSTVYADFYTYTSVSIDERKGGRKRTSIKSLPRTTALNRRVLSSIEGVVLYRPRPPVFTEPPARYDQVYHSGDARILDPTSPEVGG